MKIAIMSDSPGVPSGFGTQGRILAEGFANVGHEVFYLGANGLIDENNPLYKEYAVNYTGYDLINKICSQIKPDIYLMFGPPTAHIGFFESSMCRTTSAYSWFAWEQAIVNEQLGRLFGHLGANRVAHLTKYGAREWQKHIPQSVVIPHGLDLNVFKPIPTSKVELRKKWSKKLRQDIRPDSFLILVLDRNDIRKRHDLNFDVIARLIDRGYSVQCIVHCKKNDARGFELEELAYRCYNLTSEQIIFTDFEWTVSFTPDELNELYNMSDARLSSSGGEGFGIPTLEAMASGCLNVVPDNTTFPELIGGSGFLVDQTSKMAFGGKYLFSVSSSDHAVEQLINVMNLSEHERQERKALGVELTKKFDRKEVVNQWLALFTKEENQTVEMKKRFRLFEYGIMSELEEKNFRIAASHIVHGLVQGSGMIYDLGCGRGTVVDSLNRLGETAYGFDNDPITLPDLMTNIAKSFCKLDQNILQLEKFPIEVKAVLMLDVIHELQDSEIDKLANDTLKNVEWLFISADTELLSPSRKRVNVRTKSKWIEYFESKGWIYQNQLEPWMIKVGKTINVSRLWTFFKGAKVAVPLKIDNAFVPLTPSKILDSADSPDGLRDNIA